MSRLRSQSGCQSGLRSSASPSSSASSLDPDEGDATLAFTSAEYDVLAFGEMLCQEQTHTQPPPLRSRDGNLPGGEGDEGGEGGEGGEDGEDGEDGAGNPDDPNDPA